jgi:hypothetical protein
VDAAAGHENFEESTEEIKPLTEEEKKAKLVRDAGRCPQLRPTSSNRRS